MPRPHPLPHGPDAKREVGSGRARMALLLVHALITGVKRNFLLVVLLLPRVAPSAADAPVSPRRSMPPDSRAATWLQRRGLRRPPQERRGISVGVGVDICALVGSSVIVRHTSLGQRHRVAGPRLFDGWAALSQFPSRGCSCTRTICTACRSRGSGSCPSSR
jgi:hypothetical protein